MLKKDIRKLSLEEIISQIDDLGFEKYRAKQIYEWIWKKSATSFDQMLNLSKKHREILNQYFAIHPASISEAQYGKDGTIKFAIQLSDKHIVEGVLIPANNRYTACVSVQVGCSLSCSFCATGKMKMTRNLDSSEIYDQVVLINAESKKHYGKELTNIVYMGMGEPLLNYRNLLVSIDKITSSEGLGMSPRRITVSTAGIAKAIRKLADDKVRFNLAVSLHAAIDSKRNQIMKINETNNLEQLTDALKYFYQMTQNRITFEYILFKGFNDTPEDVRALALLCNKVPAKVNIIEYNKVEGVELTKTGMKTTKEFQSFLKYKGVTSQVRQSRGSDIDAACGQLANKNLAAQEKQH